jgi:FkbM family methyltransferase
MNLIFDIGAHLGSTVKIFTKKKAGRIIAFEPNPLLVDNLREVFKNNNVTVDTRGLSNEIGTKIFNVSYADSLSTFSQDWIHNSRFSDTITWDTQVEVETTTLDNVIEEYGIPDYVKIDVEGYEYEVLSSLTKFLPDTLFAFEWAEETKDKIYLILEHVYNLGYKSFGYTEEDKVLFDGEIDWVEYQEFLKTVESFQPKRKIRWGMIYFKK